MIPGPRKKQGCAAVGRGAVCLRSACMPTAPRPRGHAATAQRVRAFPREKLHAMRIDLICPFAEKDQAKALGAQWDAAHKVWFIKNVEDLTPFARWIPEILGWDEKKAAAKAKNVGKAKATPKPPRKTAPKTTKARLTGPVDALPSCGCNALPWEHCAHTKK